MAIVSRMLHCSHHRMCLSLTHYERTEGPVPILPKRLDGAAPGSSLNGDPEGCANEDVDSNTACAYAAPKSEPQTGVIAPGNSQLVSPESVEGSGSRWQYVWRSTLLLFGDDDSNSGGREALWEIVSSLCLKTWWVTSTSCCVAASVELPVSGMPPPRLPAPNRFCASSEHPVACSPMSGTAAGIMPPTSCPLLSRGDETLRGQPSPPAGLSLPRTFAAGATASAERLATPKAPAAADMLGCPCSGSDGGRGKVEEGCIRRSITSANSHQPP